MEELKLFLAKPSSRKVNCLAKDPDLDRTT